MKYVLVGSKVCLMFSTRKYINCYVLDLQWLALLESMRKEAEWLKNKVVPSMDEYMENGYVSFALGPIVLPTLYFVGPKLPEEVIGNCEYKKLFKLMSTCGRLLNDTRTFDVSTKTSCMI